MLHIKHKLSKLAAGNLKINNFFFTFTRNLDFPFSGNTCTCNMISTFLLFKIQSFPSLHTTWSKWIILNHQQALAHTLSKSLVVVLGGLQSTLCLTHKSSKICRVSEKNATSWIQTIKQYPILSRFLAEKCFNN